jgi:hypothetical protein
MAQLIITRPDQFANLLRTYKILLNGQQVTRLVNNKTNTITLSAGVYTIQAKIDWTTSQPLQFTLAEQDKLHLMVSCNTTLNTPQKVLYLMSLCVLGASV